MFKIITYIFLIIFYFIPLSAEIAKEIKISGNKRVSDETIKVYGDIEVNKNYNEVELIKFCKT